MERKNILIVNFLVAGAGIAPASQGYEPREVLLLHPAIHCLCYITLQNKANKTNIIRQNCRCSSAGRATPW